MMNKKEWTKSIVICGKIALKQVQLIGFKIK